MLSAPTTLPPAVSLLVASLDLELVQLLRSAIRTADLSQGSTGRATALAPAATGEARLHLHPEPVYEARPHFHPSAVGATRPALGVTDCDNHEPRPSGCADDAAGGWPAYPPAPPPDCEQPMQAPWKVLPWQNPPPIQNIKVLIYRPDIAKTGTTIDLFI